MTITSLDGRKCIKAKAGVSCPLLVLPNFTNNIQGYTMGVIELIV